MGLRRRTFEGHAVEACLVALGTDGDGLRAFAVAVDDVDVVDFDVANSYAESGRAIVANAAGLAKVVCDGDFVAGVARSVGCVAIENQRSLEAFKRDLLLVCTLVDPDCER